MSIILSIGDCNTRGARELEFSAYPEMLAHSLNCKVINCGHTMTTTREGIQLFSDNYTDEVKLVTVQYGLVDSWITVSHAPYVHYYPDSVKRKIWRKIVKKYKKIARKIHLDAILGSSNLVPLNEYITNIESMIRLRKETPVLLLETVPNRESKRNPEILRYNNALREIANSYENVFLVELYQLFYKDLDNLLLNDNTHINAAGYDLVTQETLKVCRQHLKL